MSETKPVLENPRLNTIFSAVAAFAAVLAVLGVLNGWLTSGSLNANDIAHLRENMTTLSGQLSNLATKDQLQAANGRITGIEGWKGDTDRRLHDDEERLRITELVANVNNEVDKAKGGHR